jgi:hypothetical protein
MGCELGFCLCEKYSTEFFDVVNPATQKLVAKVPLATVK